jgi:hypothetical protein
VEPFRRVLPAGLLLAVASFTCHNAIAQQADAKTAAVAEKVDQERLTVRRLDVVDERGVVRMTLAAPTPDPTIAGVQYKRAFPASGMVLFDKDGHERGGQVVADIPGTAAAIALDHANGDAIGWKVMPDGEVQFIVNQRGTMQHDPKGNVLLARDSKTRILMSVAPDGTPSIGLADKQERTRVRLTVTDEGFGAIQFLDANGTVVETLAPERSAKR